MKRTAFFLALLLVCLTATACAGAANDGFVDVPGAGIVPNPDSNMYKDYVAPDKETEDEALDPYSAEQESMKGSAVIYLPTVPVTPKE
jgi:hypothetical protein